MRKAVFTNDSTGRKSQRQQQDSARAAVEAQTGFPETVTVRTFARLTEPHRTRTVSD